MGDSELITDLYLFISSRTPTFSPMHFFEQMEWKTFFRCAEKGAGGHLNWSSGVT